MITGIKHQHDDDTHINKNTDNKRNRRRRWRVIDVDALNAECATYQTNQITLQRSTNKQFLRHCHPAGIACGHVQIHRPGPPTVRSGGRWPCSPIFACFLVLKNAFPFPFEENYMTEITAKSFKKWEADAATIGEILGLTSRRITQLAADGAIKRNTRGKYPVAAAIAAYLKVQSTPSAARERLLEARAKSIELQNSEREHRLIDTEEAIGALV
jgi:hypothetical protein